MTSTNQHLQSARRCQNNLPIQTGPDPFLGWAFILQAITPSAKKRGLATRDYYIFTYYIIAY